jgi:hypothetical protein
MTVSELNDDLMFLSDYQDVQPVQENTKTDYTSYFVNNDYTEIWGMNGIIPYLYREVYRIK